MKFFVRMLFLMVLTGLVILPVIAYSSDFEYHSPGGSWTATNYYMNSPGYPPSNLGLNNSAAWYSGGTGVENVNYSVNGGAVNTLLKHVSVTLSAVGGSGNVVWSLRCLNSSGLSTITSFSVPETDSPIAYSTDVNSFICSAISLQSSSNQYSSSMRNVGFYWSYNYPPLTANQSIFYVYLQDFTNGSIIKTGNLSFQHNIYWTNKSNPTGALFYQVDGGGNRMFTGDAMAVCADAPGYFPSCDYSFIPTNYTVYVKTLSPNFNPWGNFTGNLTNVTLPAIPTLGYPNITIVNKTDYRNSINSSIIGNLTSGLLGQADEMYNSVNATATTIEDTLLTPITILVSLWKTGLSMFIQSYSLVVGYTLLPLAITSAIINIIPQPIQILITLGLAFDLIFIILFGGH